MNVNTIITFHCDRMDSSQRYEEPEFVNSSENNVTVYFEDELVAMLGADKVTDNCWVAILERADKDYDFSMSIMELDEVISNKKEPEACL